MLRILFKIRTFLWRILGINYSHILKAIDFVYLSQDRYTTMGIGSYENNSKVFRWSNDRIEIGNYCCIAADVSFIVDQGGHQVVSEITSYPFWGNCSKRKGIKIGSDVWIGHRVIILPGVTIGNGVTIAANSVVTKDIPDYVIAAGVPAVVVKKKLSDKQIKKMNEIEWWNWPESTILQRLNDFCLSVDEFICKYDTNSHK